MAMEPIQDLVRLDLQADGYFVRNNVRYGVDAATKRKGRKAADHSEIDILAVKIDPKRGAAVDRLWGETRGHLTDSLTGGHLRAFAPDYAVLLGESAWSDTMLMKRHGAKLQALRVRQTLAKARTVEVLGEPFRRILYFCGREPKDGGKDARVLLDPAVEVVYVRDIVRTWTRTLTHLEGIEDVTTWEAFADALYDMVSAKPSDSS